MVPPEIGLCKGTQVRGAGPSLGNESMFSCSWTPTRTCYPATAQQQQAWHVNRPTVVVEDSSARSRTAAGSAAAADIHMVFCTAACSECHRHSFNPLRHRSTRHTSNNCRCVSLAEGHLARRLRGASHHEAYSAGSVGCRPPRHWSTQSHGD